MDLTPEQTTATGVRARAARSAETSQLPRASRCTPPKPPVAKSLIPASAARWAVAATVVAPWLPFAAATARSRAESLATPAALAISSRSSGSRPTFAIPPITPTVAGTAPSARTACSACCATSRLSGLGRPWEIRVDSSATTGAPLSRASATSPRISRSKPCPNASFGTLRGGLDATWVVVRGAVDEAAHRVGLHPVLGERREQAGQLVALGGGVEPDVVGVGGQDHRHPLVYLAHEGVRLGGEDRTGPDLAFPALAPALPEPGEGEGPPVLHVDVVGLLGTVRAPPLVETVGRDQAPALAEGPPEGGLLGGRLGAGVDHARAYLRVVGPRGDEAPPEHLQAPLPALLEDRRDPLRGRDVVVLRKLDGRALEAELLCQPLRLRRQRVPAAHT